MKIEEVVITGKITGCRYTLQNMKRWNHFYDAMMKCGVGWVYYFDVTYGGPEDEEYGQDYEGMSWRDFEINEHDEKENQTYHTLNMSGYQHHELYEKLFYKERTNENLKCSQDLRKRGKHIPLKKELEIYKQVGYKLVMTKHAFQNT